MARPRKPHDADCLCDRCEDDAVESLRAEWQDRRDSVQRLEAARLAIAALDPAELDAVAGEMAANFASARAQVKASLALPAPKAEPTHAVAAPAAKVIDVGSEDDVLVGWDAICGALGQGIGKAVADKWASREDDALPLIGERKRGQAPRAKRGDLSAWLKRNADMIAAMPKCSACLRVGHRAGSQVCQGAPAESSAEDDGEPEPETPALGLAELREMVRAVRSLPSAVVNGVVMIEAAPTSALAQIVAEPEPPHSDVFALLAEMRADGTITDDMVAKPEAPALWEETAAAPTFDPVPPGAPPVGARVRWFSVERDARVDGRVLHYQGGLAHVEVGDLGISESVPPDQLQRVTSLRVLDDDRRRGGAVARPETIKGRITAAELEQIAADIGDYDDSDRPRTRGECRPAARPCPWVSCKHHLYLDLNATTGTIKINFPDREPWELDHSCALDVADAGGATLEEVGEIMNLTRERARQIEVKGLVLLKQRMAADRDQIDVVDVGDPDELVGWLAITRVVGRDDVWCRARMREADPLPIEMQGKGRPARASAAEIRAWKARNAYRYDTEQCSACGEYGHRSHSPRCPRRAEARTAN